MTTAECCRYMNKRRLLLCSLTIWSLGNSCGMFIAVGIREDYCCWGYCIDMLIQIADMVNFTYSIHLGSSGEFGSYKKVRLFWNMVSSYFETYWLNFSPHWTQGSFWVTWSNYLIWQKTFFNWIYLQVSKLIKVAQINITFIRYMIVYNINLNHFIIHIECDCQNE